MVAPSVGIAICSSCKCSTPAEIFPRVCHHHYLIVSQLLFTLWLEKGLIFALRLTIKQTLCGSWLFYLFLVQTRAYHFGEALVHGRGTYVATGRGYSLEPGKFVELYKQYAQVAQCVM